MLLNFDYEKVPDVDLYLEKIQYDGPLNTTLDTLNELVWANQRHLPYDNLSVCVLHEEVSIKTEDLFNKIIRGNRGGYCYELNGLFMHFLRTLGFDAYSVMGRVAWNVESIGGPGHRETVVYIDGHEYVCDVGFTGPNPTFALETVDRFQSLHFEKDLYRCQDLGNGWRATMRSHTEDREAGRPVSVYGSDHNLDIDFEFGNYFTSQHPDSMFKKRRSVCIKTDDGYKKIINNTYIERHNGVKTVVEYDDSELDRILKDKFNIVLDRKD